MNPKQNYGCAHWHSEKDVVALKCPCHNEFHPCLLCHEDKYGIPPERWPEESWAQEKAILCRVCETALTIADYMTYLSCSFWRKANNFRELSACLFYCVATIK